jgi:hypothetical protein
MARDITVTFDDGSSHVYNNAPDDITFDKALARAQSEFKGRAVTNIDGGRKPVATKTVTPEAEKPSAKPPANEPRPDLGSPMGSGFEESLSAPKEQKIYTGSVFDTIPFPETKISPEEAARLSNRAYAERTTQMPRKAPPVMQATPEEQLNRSTGQSALDTTIGLLQGVVGFPKGIAGNINAGDNPIAKYFQSAIEAGERSKSAYLQNQAAQRDAFIKNVTANQGELAGARATFTSMFSPAGVDIIAQGAGSVIPTMGMSLLNLGRTSMVAVSTLSNAGDAAVQSAEQLKQIPPEQWGKDPAYQNLRDSGLSHRDAVNMLAPIYALPAQTVGAIAGAISGSTGLEKKLTQGAKRGLRASAGRFGAELAGEEVESLAPQFVGNVFANALDKNISPTEGLGRTAVETAFGSVPGAALAAIPSRQAAQRQQQQQQEELTQTPEELARQKGFLVSQTQLQKQQAQQEQPSADLGALGEARPGEDLQQTVAPKKEIPVPPASQVATEAIETPAEPQVDEAKVKALTEQLQAEKGYTAANARRIALARVLRGESKPKASITDITGEVPSKLGSWNNLLLQTTLDFQMQKPEALRNEPLIEAIQTEIAKRQQGQGAENVTEPITSTGGAGVSVAGRPSENIPPTGAGKTVKSRVVPTRQDVTGTVDGEATKPTALTPEQHRATRPPYGEPQTPERKAFNQWEKEQTILDKEAKLEALQGRDESTIDWNSEWEGDTQVRSLADARAEIADLRKRYELPASIPITKQPVEQIQPAPVKETKETPTLEEQIKAEDERNAAFEAKKAKVESIAKINASFAFDQVSNYPNLQEAIDSYEINMGDTLVEEGFRNDPDYDALVRAADRAFTAEVNRQKGITSGTKTPEAVQTTQEGQAQPTPAKRGPKGARLAPEQKLTSDQKRAQQRLDANQASKNVAKAEAILQDASKPLNEADYDDEAALAEAEKDQRARRGSALRTLYQVSRENKNKPGQRATELLKNANPKEVADAKAAYEYRKANGILSSRASTAPADANFSKAKNGAQALTYIIKNSGSYLEKFVALRIRSFVGGVKFVVIEKNGPTPTELQTGRNAEAWARARGVYIQNDETKTRTVYVRGASFGEDQGVNNVTVLHELLHAATNQKIALGMLASVNGFSTDAKITKFVEEINGLAMFAQDVYKYSVANKIPLSKELRSIVEATKTTDPDTGEVSYEIFSKPQEFVAYGMSDPYFQDYLNRLPGRRENGFSQFVRSILNFFGLGQDKFTALSDLIDVTDKLLSARKTPTMRLVEEGMPSEPFEQRRSAEELAKEWKRAEEVYKKSAASTKFKNRGIKQKAFEKLNPQEAMNWVKSYWPFATKIQREVMARLPSLPFLGSWAEELGLPHIREASELMTQMLGAEKVLAENTEQLIYQLKKGFKADPELQEKLTQLVYITTNAEIDPSDPNAAERSARADAMYKALGTEGQRLYKLTKEHYEDRGDLFLQLLEDNLEHLGLEPDTKKNLLSVLRKSYEADKRIRPYFPFVRDEGQYWLAVGKDENREFYIYENMQDREADRARIIKEQKISKDDTSIGDSLDSLRKEAYETSSLVREVFDAIDKIPVATNENGDVTAKYKESLKDAVYQGYLNVLPEKSFRGMFKHRKGLAGYRTDLIQNIAAIDGKMNRQLARLEYSQRIRNITNAAQEAIKERPDLQPFVSELRRRVNNFLSPEPHNGWDIFTGALGRVGFTYLLSGFSLPLIQPLALATSGISILYGNYKTSMARAGAEIINAYGNLPTYGITTTLPDGSTRYTWPSLVNSKSLVGDELQAMKEFAQSGMHESTLTRDVWTYAGKPTSSFIKTPGKELEYYANRTMQGIDTVVGSPFHIMERWTREALFLAAYRLGKRDKLSHDEAVTKAIANVKEALGDYDTSAKPRWMQRGLGKAAFALKTFAVLVTEQTIGNLVRSIPGLNKEGKAAAIKKFSGIMLTMSVLAGASGAPLASVFYSVAASIVMSMQGAEGDDDDDEEEAELREMDKGLWFRHVWLPRNIPDVEIGGVKLYDWIDRGVLNAITGFDFASRVQISTVWGPDIPKPAKTSMEAALNLAKDYFAGPYYSLAEQFMNAYDAYSNGDDKRYKELISPKAIRDWLKGDRYEEEGVKLNGKQIIEQGDLEPLLIWAQRLGFAPDIVSITQKQGIQATSALQTVNIEREHILKKLDVAASKDTPEGDAEFEKLYEEVDAFNKKYPNAELKNPEINASLDKREKLRADAIAGISLTKKQVNALTPLLERMNERLDRQQEKAEEKRKGQ